MLAQIIHRMVTDEEDRKDLAQEIYLKAFRKMAEFKYESKLTTWICQIGYNTCIDFLRKKKIRPLFQHELAAHGDEESGHRGEIFVADQSADKAAAKKELSLILKQEIGKLSPVYQTLVTLFHTEELSYEEIGQITGLPQGTIKSYLSRARKLLRESLSMNYSKQDL